MNNNHHFVSETMIATLRNFQSNICTRNSQDKARLMVGLGVRTGIKAGVQQTGHSWEANYAGNMLPGAIEA